MQALFALHVGAEANKEDTEGATFLNMLVDILWPVATLLVAELCYLVLSEVGWHTSKKKAVAHGCTHRSAL